MIDKKNPTSVSCIITCIDSKHLIGQDKQIEIQLLKRPALQKAFYIYFLQHFCIFLQLMCIFSKNPLFQVFLQLSYPTRFGARSLLRTQVCPFGLYKRSNQPAHAGVRASFSCMRAALLRRYCGVRVVCGQCEGGLQPA